MRMIESLSGAEPGLRDLLVLGDLAQRARDLADGLGPADWLFGACDGGLLVGIAFGLDSSYFNRCEVHNLLVHPEHRRRGIGSMLMEHVIAHARRQGLGSVVLTMHPPERRTQQLSFYSTLGFQVVSSVNVDGRLMLML